MSDLAEHGNLPAIYFVFSRAGCDEAADACVAAGIDLAPSGSAAVVEEVLEEQLRTLDAESRAALDLARWRGLLHRGIASHHAGLVPPLKEAVERLFARNALGVVFATETLALGVNLPARTVVIESTSKYRGDGHSPLTPAEYAQLTGRAGRRGIDPRGDAVVLWSPWVPFETIAELAASDDFELRSAFRPTYNMAANLVATTTPEGARRVLGSSLAQYQADRRVLRLRRRRERIAAELADVEADLRERLGDAAVDRIVEGAVRPGLDAAVLARLRPGDLVGTRDDEVVALLSVANRGGRLRFRAVDVEGRARRLPPDEVVAGPGLLGRVDLPVPYAPNRSEFRDEVADALRRVGPATGPTAPSAAPTRRAVARLRTGRAELDDLERRAARSDGDLLRRFDVILDELGRRGFVDGWRLTPRGAVLAGIFHECDLLIAECVVAGGFDDLDEAQMASLASCFVYEHRAPDPPPAPWFPDEEVAERFQRAARLARDLRRFEAGAGLPETREPDPGFVPVAHGWVLDVDLATLLDEEELSGGDFVRTARQLVDLLGQLGHVLDGEAAATARRAAGRVDRGLVATTGLADEPDDPNPGDVDGHLGLAAPREGDGAVE